MADIKRNCREIKEGCKIRPIYCVIIYLLITGILVPSFGSFSYFFMLDVVGISKFAYAMLTVLGYFTLLIGTSLFNRYFKEADYWKLIMCDSLIGMVLAPLSFIFVFRLNVAWGISDMALIIFTSVVTEVLS